MKIKSYISIIALALLTLGGSMVEVLAQNKMDKTDDLGRIAIVPYVTDQIEDLPEIAKNNLRSKMAQILTKQGIAGSAGFSSQFIMVPNISVLSKDVVAGAPPKVALNLEVAFYIGDGINGVKYGSAAVMAKGVGSTETKAYVSALRNISSSNKDLAKLIDTAKERILEYYNDGCDFIIKEANNLAAQNKFDEALYALSSVPVVSKECFNKAQDRIGDVYQQMIDRDCDMLLNQATNAWNAGQNYEAAVEATELLNQIEPESACFSKVKTLSKSIRAGIKDTNNKEWAMLNKQLESITEIEKNRLSTTKEIALAYANNQPKNVVYNVKGWW
ncbi:hypothetical protein N9W69_01405 [Flavobacteriaceae bacterium]|nr:hypothetical protein [Flavobacteriaceae bacterium]